MLSEADREMIQEIVFKELAMAQTGIVQRVRAELFDLMQQFSVDLAAAQSPLVGEMVSQRDDICHLITAVKDLQNAVQVLAEKMSGASVQPDPDDWWRNPGDADE